MKISHLFIALFCLSLPSLASAANSGTKFLLNKNSELTIQGSSNVTAAFRNQSSAFEQDKLDNATNNRQDQNSAFENNSQLYLKLENKNPENSDQIKFGTIIKIESELSSAQNKGTINADQSFVYANSESFGKVELGDNIAVNQKMKVGPASFARGAGGINGNYLKYINLPSTSQFILIAQSIIGHSGSALSGSQINQNSIKILRDKSFNGSEDATKINYYSPRFEGLQLGASYTPNSSNSLVSSTVFNGKNNAFLDVISLGANYTNSFNNFDYAFSATSEQAKSNETTQNNLSAYDIATTMAYFGFTFGASYGSWKKSAQNTDQTLKNSTYRTLGISYQIGHFSISLTNLKSNFEKNDYQATSLGLDYKLSKVFIPYLEITQFRFKSNQSQIQNIADNKGFVALTGFLISF